MYQGGDPRWVFDLTREEIEALATSAIARLEYQQKALEEAGKNSKGSSSGQRGKERHVSLDSIPPDGISG